jgi:hypothetical protein
MKYWLLLAAIFVLSILPDTGRLCAQTLWTKNPVPLVRYFESFDPKTTSIYMPTVILDGATYRMWYSRKIANTEKIGYATSTDAVHWTNVDTSVIAPSSGSTRCDINKSAQATVIRDGDTLKMWYWGDGGRGGNICYARSIDGRVWTKVDGPNTDKSVYSTTQDAAGAIALTTPNVIKDGATYRMWYAQILMSGTDFLTRLGAATSSDGLNWTKVNGTGPGGSVLDLGPVGRFDEKCVFYPCVRKTNTGYEMWYTGGETSPMAGTFRIGYAVSTNGTSWTRVAGTMAKGSVIDTAGSCSVIKSGTQYQMWLSGTDPIYYATATATGVRPSLEKAVTFGLSQNFPNPFNPSTTIRFSIPVSAEISLSIFDLLGRKVATLVEGAYPPGVYLQSWDARKASSGIYIYRLEMRSVDNLTSTLSKRLILLR